MTATLIGYARCSTDKQDLAAQRAALEKLGVAPERIYMDRGLTGTNRSRPGLDQALASSAPPADMKALPRRRGVGQALQQRWQALANDARAPHRSAPSRRRGVEQTGIKAQPGDHADAFAHGAQQRDSSEATVRDGDDAPLREPASNLK